MKITNSISFGLFQVWVHGAEAVGGFIALPITRHTPSQALARRQTAVSLPATERAEYLIDVDIGTPKQRVQLAVDVGTTGTMVMGTCKSPYYGRSTHCEERGVYNESLSTTGMFVADDGLEKDHSEAEVEQLSWYRMRFYADDVTIAGQATLKNTSFAAYQSAEVFQNGFLGLGFGDGAPARGVLDDLVAEGSIDARAFGITFGGGGDDDNTGSLVLGGVDTKKFSGSLTKVHVADPPPGTEDGQLLYYWMAVDGATLDDGDGGQRNISGFTVAPSSTSPFSSLPGDIVVAVAEAFGVRNWTDPEWSIIPCSRADGVKGSLELDFSGFTASISYTEFIQPLEGTNEKGDCLINVQVQQMDFGEPLPVWYLGNTFLRSVYAVFDQDNMAVWLAKSADCGSEPVAFKGSDVKGQCEGSSNGGGSSDTQGGSENNDGGSAGSRVGAGNILMLGAVLVALIIYM